MFSPIFLFSLQESIPVGRVNLNNGEVKVLYSDEEAVPSADNSQGNTSAWIVVLFYKKILQYLYTFILVRLGRWTVCHTTSRNDFKLLLSELASRPAQVDASLRYQNLRTDFRRMAELICGSAHRLTQVAKVVNCHPYIENFRSTLCCVAKRGKTCIEFRANLSSTKVNYAIGVCPLSQSADEKHNPEKKKKSYLCGNRNFPQKCVCRVL